MRAFAVVSALLGIFLMPAITRSEEPETDLERLQGTWGAIRYVENGEDGLGADEEINPEESPVRWEFKKNTIAFLADVEEASAVGTFELISRRKPKTVDFVFASPDAAQGDQTLQGIYKLDGPKLTICYGVDEAARPKTFKSKQGSKLILVEFRRINE